MPASVTPRWSAWTRTTNCPPTSVTPSSWCARCVFCRLLSVGRQGGRADLPAPRSHPRSPRDSHLRRDPLPRGVHRGRAFLHVGTQAVLEANSLRAAAIYGTMEVSPTSLCSADELPAAEPGAVPEGAAAGAGGDGPGGARPGHPHREHRHPLRLPRLAEALRAPHGAHGARRARGHRGGPGRRFAGRWISSTRWRFRTCWTRFSSSAAAWRPATHRSASHRSSPDTPGTP